MKLHLPTKLRAAVIAAMAFLAAAPTTATATTFDPTAAVYTNAYRLFEYEHTMQAQEKNTAYREDVGITNMDETGLRDASHWALSLEAKGWSASSGNYVFGWTDKSLNAASDVLNGNQLTVKMENGFMVMITGGKLLVVHPDPDGKIFKATPSRYTDGIIASMRKAEQEINLNLNFFYDTATTTLTLKNGTVTLSDGKVITVDEHSWVLDLATEDVFHYGISNANGGAYSLATFYVPDAVLRQWNITGLTSLDKMASGDTYIDTATGDFRQRLDTDTINFSGENAVLYAETTRTISNLIYAGDDPAFLGQRNVIGLGAAAGQTLTVADGASLLQSASVADGLRITGEGTVAVQNADSVNLIVEGLSIDDGATLRYEGTGAGALRFVMDGTGTGMGSTLVSDGTSTMELQATAGANVTIGTVTTQTDTTSRLDLTSAPSKEGAFTIGTLNLADRAEVGPRTTLTVGTVNGAEDSTLQMYEGSALTAHDVTVGTLNVGLKPTTITGTLTAKNFGMGTDNVRMVIEGRNGNAFTATKVKTAYDAKSIVNAATLADAEVHFAPALKTQLNVSDTVDNTYIGIRGTGLDDVSSIDIISATEGMSTDSAATTVGGALSAHDITLDSYGLTAAGDITAEDIVAKGNTALSTGGTLSADNLTLNGSAAAITENLTVTGTTTLTDNASLAVEEDAETDELTLSDNAAVLVGGNASVGTLMMSGEGAGLAAKHLEVGVGNITIFGGTGMPLTGMVAMEDVVMEDALLTTTSGTTSGVSAASGNPGSLTIGSGYTLTGVTEDGSAADLTVGLVNLADNATLNNFAVGADTVISASGTQHLNDITFAGGYDKMSLGGVANYITVSDALPNSSTLDSVTITGTADASTLAASFITINGEDLYFDTTGQDYVLLTTGDGVTLDFDTENVNSHQFNLTPYTIASLTVENDGAGQQLIIHGREAKEEIMDSLRTTPNRSAAMDNIDEAVAGGVTGEMQDLFNYVGDVYHPTLEQRQAALSAASGASLANLSDAQRRGIEDVQKNLRNRIVQMGGHGDGVLHGGLDHADIQAWAQGDGAFHTLGQNGDEAGYDTTIWGGTVGANLDLNEHWTIGGALSVENGSITGKGSDNLDADTMSCYVNLFARYQTGHWTHMGIFTIGRDDVDTTRTVLGMTGEGSTSGTSFSGYYEAGYIFAIGGEGRQILQPIVNVSFTSAKMDSFTETGSIGNAGLKYGSNDLFYGNVGIGARYQAVLSESVYERDTVLELRGQLNQHFGDGTDEADLSFIGGGKQFTGHGAESGNFGVQLGAGISVPVGVQTTLFGDVDGEFRSHQTDFRANIGVRFDF